MKVLRNASAPSAWVITILTFATPLVVRFSYANANHCNSVVGRGQQQEHVVPIVSRGDGFDKPRRKPISPNKHSLLNLQQEVPKKTRQQVHAVDLSHDSGAGSSCRISTSCTKHQNPERNSLLGVGGGPELLLSKRISLIPRCGGAFQSSNDELKQVQSSHGGAKTTQTIHPHRQKIHTSRGGGRADTKQIGPNQNSNLLHKSEIPRFIGMSTMMFLFIYVYTTARDTKDTLIVSNCGAESIPFLKMYGVMPSAFLFIIGYSKLSQVLEKKALFHATLVPFFGFYAVFAFFLYPNRDKFHLVQAAGDVVVNGAGAGAGAGVGGAAMNLIRYWSFSLYFIISELWASAGVPLLFWQVANDITTVSQAKRFYPLFAVTGNLAPILSGKVMQHIVSNQPSDGEGFGATLKSLATIKVICGIAIIILYNLIYMGAEESTCSTSGVGGEDDDKMETKVKGEAKNSTSKKTARPSLSESISELSKSSELKSMASMVLGYNVCVELTEVLWKGILRKTHPSESAYMSFMASFSQKVGIIAIVLQLSASTIINKLGWTRASQLTPLTMLLLAIPFFMTVALSKQYPGTIPLTTALTIGTWQNVVNKIAKYSLFDPLKEMAYIPLPPDAKTKGKAAIDVLGARLGRSIASGSQQILVVCSGGSILECAPYLAGLYFGTISLWLSAVNALGKMFETNHGDDDNDDDDNDDDDNDDDDNDADGGDDDGAVDEK